MARPGLSPTVALAALAAWAAFLVGCGSEPAGPSDPPGEKPPDAPSLTGLRVEPLVTAPGETFRLELTVADAPDPKIEVQLRSPLGAELFLDGTSLETTLRVFDLFDDGTHGDREVGDGVFSRNGLTFHAGSEVASAVAFGVHFDGTPFEEETQVHAAFRHVDPDRSGRPPVSDVAADLRATPHVVSLATADALDMSEEALASFARRYYEVFPDDRHVLIVARPPNAGSIASGLAYRIRSWAEGLGIQGNRGIPYGSGVDLHLVIDARRTLWVSGPDPDGAFCLPIHELTHQWAANTGPPLSDGTGHWLFNVLDRDASGFGIDGVCRFNDLEAYLAGWVPADSVVAPLTVDGYGIQDLVADLGRRVPAVGPRDLRMGLIVVYDRLLTDTELAYFDRVVREFAGPTSSLDGLTWREATGGRSTLDAALPAPAPRPASPSRVPR